MGCRSAALKDLVELLETGDLHDGAVVAQAAGWREVVAHRPEDDVLHLPLVRGPVLCSYETQSGVQVNIRNAGGGGGRVA